MNFAELLLLIVCEIQLLRQHLHAAHARSPVAEPTTVTALLRLRLALIILRLLCKRRRGQDQSEGGSNQENPMCDFGHSFSSRAILTRMRQESSCSAYQQ
jgi:hypothetical protein